MKKVIKRKEDIFLLHPEWKLYCDFKKNESENIDVYSLTRFSHVKVYWKCKNCETKFRRSLSKVKNEILCNACALKEGINKKYSNIINQEGSLAVKYPELVKEWHPTKNGKLTPEELTYASNKKVWWLCPNGHSYEKNVAGRTLANRGCPYCTNQKVLKGYNDLETVFPNFLKEWNYEKNTVLPSQIIARSGKKYWWICELGHEWQTSPLDRTYGRGCPICSSERKVSIGEKTILYYIMKNYNGKIIPNYRSELINNKELDIYLPELKIGIEYDGVYFHKNRTRDLLKDNICNDKGIKVFHVAECHDKNEIKGNYIYFNVNRENNFEWALKELLNIIFFKNNEYDVNISRDRTSIYNLLDYSIKEQSLAKNYPELAKEWHPAKNGKLKPELVSYGSDKKVWWRCDKGHEWEAVISSRVSGVGCPFCSGNRVIKGENDLLTLYPLIAAEWHPTKNGDLKPNEVAIKSNKKVWWLAKCGHEWETLIISRISGNNCPYCGNQKLLKGFNDFKTKNPELAKEWHPTKNGNLKPEDVISGSHKKVWWLAKCSHEWEAAIGDRTIGGNGCPFCSNNKLLVGFNDLKTKNPELVKEWHPTKNGIIKPENFFPNSHEKVWWICPKGHEYESYIIHRNNGTGCPICSCKIIIKGINDLETLNPNLAKYWDYKRNKEKPSEVSIKSGKRVWWLCSKCKSSWNGRIADVAKKKNICSACANRKK